MGILMQEWIKYDKESIKIPKKVMAATKSYRNENNIVGQFIDTCEIVNNIKGEKGIVAPTEFEILYYQYVSWCESNAYKKPLEKDKRKIKEEFIKWQRFSSYGLQIGKAKENCINGTEMKPKFNLIYTPE